MIKRTTKRLNIQSVLHCRLAQRAFKERLAISPLGQRKGRGSRRFRCWNALRPGKQRSRLSQLRDRLEIPEFSRFRLDRTLNAGLLRAAHVHVSRAVPEDCDHDWEDDHEGNPWRCTKCGGSFTRYVHSMEF